MSTSGSGAQSNSGGNPQQNSGMGGTLAFLAAVLGVLVGVATIVDFISSKKTVVLLIAIAVGLVILAIAYAGYRITRSQDRRLAFVVICLILVAALGGGFSGYLIHTPAAPAEAGSGNQGPSNSPPGPGPQATEVLQAATFEKPANGERIAGTFVAEGKTPPLNGDSLWFFVYAGSSSGPDPVYYKTSDSPVTVTNNLWSTRQDLPGGSQDIGMTFTLALVRANENCSATVRALKPDQFGDYVVGARLPTGCSLAATTTMVRSG